MTHSNNYSRTLTALKNKEAMLKNRVRWLEEDVRRFKALVEKLSEIVEGADRGDTLYDVPLDEGHPMSVGDWLDVRDERREVKDKRKATKSSPSEVV